MDLMNGTLLKTLNPSTPAGSYVGGASSLSSLSDYLLINGGLIKVENVAKHGAKGDGVYDDTSPIMAAFNALGNGPGIVYSPFLQHKITSTLQIGNGTLSSKSSINSISFIGRGGNPTAIAAGDNGGTKLLWYGDSNTPMVQVNGPITNVYMENFQLNCRSIAPVGLHVFHCHGGVFRRITITNYSVVGLDIDALGSNPLPAGVLIGGDDCLYERVDCAGVAGSSAIGLRLGPANYGSVSDNARNSFHNCWFWGSNSASGIGGLFRYTDNCSFYQCGFQAGPGFKAIYVEPPPGNLTFPAAVQFYSCFVVGTVSANPAWNPTHKFSFYGLSVTDGGSSPIGDNRFFGFDSRGVQFGV